MEQMEYSCRMLPTGGAKPTTGGTPGKDIFLSSTEEVLNLLCDGPADLGTMLSRSRSNSGASTDPFDADEAFPNADDLPSVLEEASPIPRLDYPSFTKYRECEESDPLSKASSCVSTPESSFNKRCREGAGPPYRIGCHEHGPCTPRRAH